MAHSQSTQTASAVLMIRPVHFQSNVQTASTNRFQCGRTANAAVAIQAVREFDGLADILSEAGVQVHALAGDATAVLPDELFPNNWFSTHRDGTLVLYPMLAENRRLERRKEIIDWLRDESGFVIRRTIDYTHFETTDAYLEGTGSLVLDHINRIAYSAISPRTHSFALARFAGDMNFKTMTFDAHDRSGYPIYHTNVLMSVGSTFALLCAEAITELAQRRALIDSLRESGRGVIEISLEQLHEFAGNALELESSSGPVIALSERALAALNRHQTDALERHGRIVSANISTIETYGGGSVRCMLAELHLLRANG